MEKVLITAENAYKPKILLQRLSSRGLELTEDALMILVDEMEGFIVESAVASKGQLDDIVVPFAPKVFGKIKSDFVDKIDGQDDIQ